MMKETFWMMHYMVRSMRKTVRSWRRELKAWRRFWKNYRHYRKLAAPDRQLLLKHLLPSLRDDTKKTRVDVTYFY